MNGDLKSGLYAVVGGVEYPLRPIDGVWSLLSLEARPTGRWRLRHEDLWVCPVTAADVEKVFKIFNEGTYRGVTVDVATRPAGGYEVSSNDMDAALSVGMRAADQWYARGAVAADDPDLVFHEVREEVPFPR